ncbi:MAG: MarR family winged helix-turn-helix transcriptional regulator [Pseudomonadota bacterium]|jgi:DNA-binding MarR family transcriptional regulator|nr:MarR family winged helix-turn-helix transcriptional regulator [Pseudomonadota bacterium]|tara:strand:+ start:6926 stop:7369 length:444 start_codon:yes stop_codon:yes gene_type:complete
MNNNDYFDPEDTIGFLLWDANRAMNREFSDRIARQGVSLGLWPFLRALWDGDGITQRELSEKVRMKGPTTVAALNKLEDRGLVRREGDKKDARKINVFLTPDGRKVYRKVIPEVEAVNTQCLTDLSAEEQAEFKNMIRRIRNNITAA